MASVSIKLPDNLKKKIEEKSEEEGYMNSSEYIRQAVREKVEESKLHPDELLRMIKQGEDIEEVESQSLDKVKEEIS